MANWRIRIFPCMTALLMAAALGTGAAPAQTQVFADGFESGDVVRWSAAREQQPGLLAVTTDAAMDGSSFGLETRAGGIAWVATREPDRETTLRVSFFFDPNNWEMLLRARVDVLRFTAQGRRHHLRLVLAPAGDGLFRVGLLVRGNRGGYEPLGGGFVAAGVENLVEVEWQAATSRNGNDGMAALYLNGELEARAPSLANGRLDVRSIQLGVVAGRTAGTRGTLHFDEFASFRTLAP